MVLIFGGVYQGKLEYALKHFSLQKEDVYFCTDADTVIPGGKKIIYELEKWILALVKAEESPDQVRDNVGGVDISARTKRLLADNPDAIFICNDISCGIVPIDPVMRKWREETGRVMGYIAQCAPQVVRLLCGIPTKLV